MKRWTIGIILLVIVGLSVWGLRQNKSNEPVPFQEISVQKSMQEIKITSAAFANNGMIPAKYTCDEKSTSPPLEIGDMPERTKTLALIMHDPDAPRAGGWTHWVKFNMKMNNELGIMNIEEGKEPEGVSGKGSGNNFIYQGPCPPSGTHHYFFNVYALDAKLSLKDGATKTELESAMKGHILGKGQLVGLYSRSR